MKEINRKSLLKIRHSLKKYIRNYFENIDFLEVDTPILVNTPNPSAHFDYIQCNTEGYLNTSPEFHMKRLLVEGFVSIYQIIACFRKSEFGKMHNPEFYMIEWYRAEAELQDVMKDFETILRGFSKDLSQYSEIKDLDLPFNRLLKNNSWEILSFFSLIKKHTNLDLNSSSSKTELLNASNILNAGAKSTYSKLDIYTLIWDKIESTLGLDLPIWVVEWPVELADISVIKLVDGKEVADRAELYFNGVELCNGFNELRDAQDHIKRFNKELENRQILDKHIPVLDDKFLNALKIGYPKSAGMAAGLERILVSLLGLDSISEVMAFDYASR